MESRKRKINLHNSSKGQENTRDLVDRISALPDSILGVILSCLPTKNAVATAILSKRWKFVWITIHNLDFCRENWKDSSNELPDDEDMKFVRYVNRVLLLHVGGFLNKFHLAWFPRCIPSQVYSWITTAITKNVHELYVAVRTTTSDPMELPISLFSCHSLQSLELVGNLSVSSATVVSLPKLECLRLIGVAFQSEETFQKLTSRGCPMLNFLHLNLDIREFANLGEDVVFTYRISSPSLKSLVLGDDNQCGCDLTQSLKLETPSLEYLYIEGCVPEVFFQGNLSSLVEADIGIQFKDEHYNENIYNSLAEGVRSFDCAITLTLSADVMWALSNAPISLSKFRRLTELKAYVICCYCSTLLDFIQSSDNLKVLSIYKEICVQAIPDHDHSNWTPPVEVSKCLTNSLKEFSIDDYTGCDYDREMIGYILMHGSALEVMQITSDKSNSEGKKLELVKEICSFQRKSAACKVEFISE